MAQALVMRRWSKQHYMKRTNNSIRTGLKSILIFTLLCTAFSTAFGKVGEATGLKEAFSLSEAQLHELLIDYYPEEFDLATIFSADVVIYDHRDQLIFEGTIELYSEDENGLIEESDFLLSIGDKHFYRLSR